jgi:GNAT superfamily N-acetyltransferase
MIDLQPFGAKDPAHHNAIAAIWNAACGPDLAIPASFVEFNTRPTTGGRQTGLLAMQADRPVGFVLASALLGDPTVWPPTTGWIDAIAVLPRLQRTGIGGTMLAWAERWLIGQGSTRAILGGSMRTFVAGLPSELSSEAFFRRKGYKDQSGAVVWDVARDLDGYTSSASFRPIDAVVRPAQPADESALMAFLRREFPDRWRFETQEYLREGGRISDYMLLESARGVDGFCRLVFEDSLEPLARYYPRRLPQPWGQLGTIGVSQDRRGKGYGAALLDAGLRRLQNRGVRGCVIDWTHLLDFYGKFGFKPYREYAMLFKELTE